MYSIATDDPFNALPRAGEHLLIDKTTRRRYPAAPTGSLELVDRIVGRDQMHPDDLMSRSIRP